jgi:hypothetical protein
MWIIYLSKKWKTKEYKDAEHAEREALSAPLAAESV